jgi:acetyl esterase/lipase
LNKKVSIAALIGAALLTSAVAPAASSPTVKPRKSTPLKCRDSSAGVHKLNIRMPEGPPITGRYAVPKGKPKGLVVFDHGYGHTSASWVQHMKIAAKKGLVAVTPDYRGIEIKPDSDKDGLPESRGWNVMKGAEDTVYLAENFDLLCPSIDKKVVFGVSMGGNTSGLAVAMASRHMEETAVPLFDYWVDVEGAVNVVETYLGARALAPVNAFAANAQADIEKEMGGTIEEKPEAYLDHAVVNHIDDIKASGVRGVVLIHGVDDGLVPYNQAREMSALLTTNQIPNDTYTVGRQSKKTDKDTTATGYVGGALDPNYDSPLAGHASEKSRVHIVMVTAFDKLWGLFKGEEPGMGREFIVDGEAGTLPAG